MLVPRVSIKKLFSLSDLNFCSILKVWDRDTMTLQASLHGHADFIIDIGISKCNRFIASSGKDAMVIIWDLKMGKIVKRLNDHQ